MPQGQINENFDKSTSYASKFKQNKQSNNSVLNAQSYNINKNQIYNQDRVSARQQMTGSSGLTGQSLNPQNPLSAGQNQSFGGLQVANT